MSRRLTTKEFIEQAKKVHNNFYSYPNAVYTTAKAKVKIECPVHGEFEQRAFPHKNGTGCPKCMPSTIAKKLTKSIDEYLPKFFENHGHKYDYSKAVYKGAFEKIKIICPVHGKFEQTPSDHSQGRGCRQCGIEKRSKKSTRSHKDFIKIAREIQPDNISLEHVEYVNSSTLIKLYCKTHDLFYEQYPGNTLKGHSCVKCGEKSMAEFNTYDTEMFIKKSSELHGNKDDYSKVEYTQCTDKIKLICYTHGEYEIKANKHLRGQRCKKCSANHSKAEQEVFDFISKHIKCKPNDRTVLNGLELDVYCKKLNFAVEYNGLRWHSSLFREDNYHINKTDSCEKKGVQLIHVFEDEWLFKRNIVKSRLKNIIGKTDKKIYARNTEVREVSSKKAMEFLEKNHLQGKTGSKVKLGLYHNNKLVSLMTFGGLRKNLGQNKKDGHWELIRFCNRLDTNVVGGASKLFKHFLKKYKPKNIISYADRRWSQGKLYEKLGFQFSHKTQPNYFYVDKYVRRNRFNYRKSELVKQGFEKAKTERQIMSERGFPRIYDCGSLKYEFKNT